MRVFGKVFESLESAHLQDLWSLEREGAIYTDHWIDELADFRHVRIPFAPDEISEFVRSLWRTSSSSALGRPRELLTFPIFPRILPNGRTATSWRLAMEKLSDLPTTALPPSLENTWSHSSARTSGSSSSSSSARRHC
jgi:hypothetical protein